MPPRINVKIIRYILTVLAVPEMHGGMLINKNYQLKKTEIHESFSSGSPWASLGPKMDIANICFHL